MALVQGRPSTIAVICDTSPDRAVLSLELDDIVILEAVDADEPFGAGAPNLVAQSDPDAAASRIAFDTFEVRVAEDGPELRR